MQKKERILIKYREVTSLLEEGGKHLSPVLFVGFIPPVNTMPEVGTRPIEQAVKTLMPVCHAHEVAFILNVDIPETRALTDAAGREMAAEIATDVLIIEDETFIAMDLESLVKNLGHNVIGVARTHSDAVALAKNKKPGLILADEPTAALDKVSGQEVVRLSTMPVLREGRLQPRPFSLRVFAAATPDGWRVMPGGFCRVSDAADARALYALAHLRGLSVRRVSSREREGDDKYFSPGLREFTAPMSLAKKPPPWPATSRPC